MEETPKKKYLFNLKTSIIIILVVALIAVLSFFTYKYLSTNDAEDSNNTEENASENSNMEEENAKPIENDNELGLETEGGSNSNPTTSTFTGTYLTAELPTGWSLIEYLDGSNTNYLTGMTTYSGLTGFAILDENDDEVFVSNGAWGIGGVSFCENYYQFIDFNQTHYDEKEYANIEIGNPTPITVDFTSTDFTGYELLGVSVRRIENKLYWDEIAGNSYFEAACDALSMATLPFESLSFNTDGYTVTTYMSSISLNSSETAKLELLDGVLESLEVN